MANLTTLEVKNLKPGPKTRRYGDGRGLYFVVRANGSKAWVQRITIDGDRTDIGLGGYPDVPLALARKKSEEIRTAVAEGTGPTGGAPSTGPADVPRRGRAVHLG